MVKCPQCNGKGEYEVITETFGGITYPVKCAICEGTGKVEKSVTYTNKRSK